MDEHVHNGTIIVGEYAIEIDTSDSQNMDVVVTDGVDRVKLSCGTYNLNVQDGVNIPIPHGVFVDVESLIIYIRKMYERITIDDIMESINNDDVICVKYDIKDKQFICIHKYNEPLIMGIGIFSCIDIDKLNGLKRISPMYILNQKRHERIQKFIEVFYTNLRLYI